MPIPTVAECLALSYGEDVGNDPYSVADLLALDYTGASANMKGLTAASYRAEMRNFGEQVIWLKTMEGVEGPNGELSTSAGKFFVDALLDEEVRVFLYQSEEDVQSEEWGEIKKGQWMISCMPDEILPLRDDRFLALDLELPFREVLIPTGTNLWPLSHRRIAQINGVYAPGELVLPSRYLVEGSSLRWIGTPPTTNVTIDYRYYPSFEFLANGLKHGPLAKDNARLSIRAPLRLLSGGEE